MNKVTDFNKRNDKKYREKKEEEHLNKDSDIPTTDAASRGRDDVRKYTQKSL